MKRYVRNSTKLPTDGTIVDRSGRPVGSYYVSFVDNYSGYNYEFGGAWRNFRTQDEMIQDIESRGFRIQSSTKINGSLEDLLRGDDYEVTYRYPEDDFESTAIIDAFDIEDAWEEAIRQFGDEYVIDVQRC